MTQELTIPEDQDDKFIELWLHDRPQHTQNAYRYEIARFKAFVQKPLPRVTLADVQSFQDVILQPLARSSRNRALAAIKSALSFGVRSGYLTVNVGVLVRLRKSEDRIAERIMSEKSMDDILRLETNERNHAMLSLLYYGGLRVSEICNLTWRSLQERDGRGQIAVYGKGDKTRHILLDTDTWREVWALRGNASLDEYVFASRQAQSGKGKQSKRLDESRVHQIVRSAADRAGVALGRVSPHWFRHAHATHALEAGAPISLVQSTLGHKSIETTAKYLHARPNDSSSLTLRRKSRERASHE